MEARDYEQQYKNGKAGVLCNIAMSIFTGIVAFVGGLFLIGLVIKYSAPEWIFGSVGGVTVLGFIIFFIVLIKMTKANSIRLNMLKTVLIAVLVGLSISFLLWWYVAYIFKNVW